MRDPVALALLGCLAAVVGGLALLTLLPLLGLVWGIADWLWLLVWPLLWWRAGAAGRRARRAGATRRL